MCLQDPTEEWKVLLRSVFTTRRTSHALPHRQRQERQAFYSGWQEVWHPLAGYHRCLCYFHISYFISVFPDWYKLYSSPVKIYFFFFWNWSSSQMSNVSAYEPPARPSRLSVGCWSFRPTSPLSALHPFSLLPLRSHRCQSLRCYTTPFFSRHTGFFPNDHEQRLSQDVVSMKPQLFLHPCFYTWSARRYASPSKI